MLKYKSAYTISMSDIIIQCIPYTLVYTSHLSLQQFKTIFHLICIATCYRAPQRGVNNSASHLSNSLYVCMHVCMYVCIRHAFTVLYTSLWHVAYEVHILYVRASIPIVPIAPRPLYTRTLWVCAYMTTRVVTSDTQQRS